MFCHSDLMPYIMVDPNCPLPAVLGHEFGGTISKITGDADDFKVGDKVTASAQISCGNCSYCNAGHDQLCEGLKKKLGENLNIGTQARDGAFAEKISVPISNLVKLPDDFDMEITGIIEPAAVAYNNTKDIKQSNVAVIAVGAIGLIATKILKLNNNNVIAVDVARKSLDMALQVGADFAVNIKDKDAIRQIKDFLKEKKVDYVLVYHTSFETVDFAFDIIKKLGEIRIIGLCAEEFLKINFCKFQMKYITLKGCWCYSMKEFRETVELITSNKLQLKDLISARYPLDKIKDAFEFKLNNAIAKVIIVNGG